MFKKIVLFLFVIIITNHCGFEPLHLSKSNANFSIEVLNVKGDTAINNYIKTNLNKFKKKEFEKKFLLKINSEYQKVTLSKNKKAKISNYKLMVTTTFEIELNGEDIKQISISEYRNINSIDDKLEEEKYEKTIKKNFASTITTKLISELSSINAN